MPDAEWERFLHFMEHEVRAKCHPQRASLSGGPFEWLQTLSGSAFGNTVGPLIVRFFLEDEMQPRKNKGHDFVCRGRPIELKSGVEHSTPGVYLFEQIRPQQDWEVLLCVGVAVRQLSFWTLSRAFVLDAIELWRETGHSVIAPQHGGSREIDRETASPDTFWLWTKPEWSQTLAPFRAVFDPSGWKGIALKKALLAD